MNDIALLMRWRNQGDAEAFRTVAVAYAPMVYGTCVRILRNAVDAEEAAQEAFFTLARTERLPQRGLAAWLHVVAANQAKKHLRTERRRLERETRYAAEVLPALAEPKWDDLSQVVDECIGDLPEKLRAPLVGHFLQGQSHAALAHEYGVSRQAVSHQIAKGIEAVRAGLKRRGIQVSAAGLAALFAANVVYAAPAGLLAHVGRIAVSGASAGGLVTGWLPGWAAGKVAAVLLVGTGVVAGACVMLFPQDAGESVAAESQPPSTARVAPAEAHASAPAKAVAESEERSATQASTHSDAVLMLADAKGPYGIHGIVYLPDGAPAVGIDVSARFVAHSEEHGPMPEGVVQTTTDEAGQYRFASLPLGRYEVLAQTNGLLDHESARPSKALPDVAVALDMEAALPLGGRVVDADGAPVAGAVVIPHSHNGKALQPSQQSVLQTTTDAKGKFLFTALRPHSWQLYCNGGSQGVLLSGAVTTGQNDATLQLQRGLSLSGRVLEEATGAPLSNVLVSVQHKSDALEQPVLTSAEGKFYQPSLLPGEYTLKLLDQKHVLPEYERKLTLQEPVDALELRGVKAGGIAGRVFDPQSNEPLKFAKVHLSAAGVEGRLPVLASDEQGHFSIHGLPPGEYELKAAALPESSDAANSTMVTVVAGGTADVDVKRPLNGMVTILVKDSAGNPAPGADLLYASTGRITTNANKDGSFNFFNQKGGEHILFAASHNGLMSGPFGPMPWEDMLKLKTIPLEVSQPINTLVMGVALDASGRPLTGDIFLWTEDRAIGLPKDELDYQGHFIMRQVPPGAYTIAVRPEGGQEQKLQALTLIAGQQVRDLRLVLGQSSNLSIVGVVTDESGQPVPARVGISKYEPRGYYPDTGSAQADQTGKFTFANLEPGEYRLKAAADGFAAGTVAPVSAGEQDVQIVCPPASIISGRVVDATGKAVTNFSVAALSELDGEGLLDRSYRQVSDGAGRFSVEAKPILESADAFGDQPMPYTLYIQAPGFAVTPYEIVEGIATGESVEDLKIVLKPKRVLRGLVSDSAGKPVAGAKIMKGHAAPEGQLRERYAVATTGEDGRFEYEPPAARRVWLWAWHPRLGTGQVGVMENEDSAEIRLLRTGTVRGRLVGDISSMKAVMIGVAGTGLSPKPDGTFVVHQVPSGKVEVHVSYVFSPEEQANERTEVILEPGGNVEVEFIVPTEGMPVVEPAEVAP